MNGYSTTSVFSIVVVFVSVIAFTLFLFLRYKNYDKLSPYLIPGILAAGMLGTVCSISISSISFIYTFRKINASSIANLPSIFGSISAPVVWSLVAAFLLYVFAIIYLARKFDRREKTISSLVSSTISKMSIIFSIVVILVILCPSILYYRAHSLIADVLAPSQSEAMLHSGETPAAVATNISSLLISSFVAGLLAWLVLISIIAICVLQRIHRSENKSALHIQWILAGTIIALVGIAAICYNIISVQRAEINWASAGKQFVEAQLAATMKSPEKIPQNPDEVPMVLVKGGTFIMGCTPEQERYCNDNENPAHQVTLSDFYIGKYEVIQAQWRAVIGENPVNFKGDDFPVEGISWDDAKEFIRQLNEKTGKAYRLPTEAEWEYVARGGAQSQGYIYSGSNISNEVANISGWIQPVATKTPNELGLYDLSGNVWEWCSDGYENYTIEPKIDPYVPGSGSTRLIRGGSWAGSESFARVSFRIPYSPHNQDNEIGLRLASSSE